MFRRCRLFSCGLLGLALTTAAIAGGAPLPIRIEPTDTVKVTGCVTTITETTGGVNYCEMMMGGNMRQMIVAYVKNADPDTDYKLSFKGNHILTLRTDRLGNCRCVISIASELARTPPLPCLRPGDVLMLGDYSVCLK